MTFADNEADAINGVIVMAQRYVGAFPDSRWRSRSSLAIWAALSVIAAVVLGRRVSGAFAREMSIAAACLIPCGSMILSLFANALYQFAETRTSDDARARTGGRLLRIVLSPGQRQVLAGVATLVPPVSLAIALLPGNSDYILVYITALFIAGSAAILAIAELSRSDGAALRGLWRRVAANRASHRGDNVPCAELGNQQSVTTVGGASNGEASRASSADFEHALRWSASEGRAGRSNAGKTDDGDDITQHVSRYVSSDGTEHLEGVVHVHLGKGLTQRVVHLPFCPTFAGTPEVRCRLLDDAPVRARVTAARTYGTRVEVKRTGKAVGPVTARVAISAAAPAGESLGACR